MNLSERITLNPIVHKGRPTIRNMCFTVANMLELLAGGMSFEEILEDYSLFYYKIGIKTQDITFRLFYLG